MNQQTTLFPTSAKGLEITVETAANGMQVANYHIPDAEMRLYPNFIEPVKAERLYRELFNQVQWQQRSVIMYGKPIPQPRLTALYGDKNKAYTYTGLTWESLEWIAPLAEIRDLIATVDNHQINGVLCNLYRDGRDGCGWHSDAGESDGKNPVIYSISLGQTRNFQIKHKRDPNYKLVNIPLTSGSLLVMGGPMQHHWQHAVPKSTQVMMPRINLTFRAVRTDIPSEHTFIAPAGSRR